MLGNGVVVGNRRDESGVEAGDLSKVLQECVDRGQIVRLMQWCKRNVLFEFRAEHFRQIAPRRPIPRPRRCREDTTVIDPRYAARFVRQHRLNGSPNHVRSACSSPLGGLNHVSSRPQPRMQRLPDVCLRGAKSKCSMPGSERYLVIILLGGVLGVCSAGEITNVTQAFHPSGRFWLANSQ
jgi:hypothetical protein